MDDTAVLKIGYLGPPGTFSEEAALAYDASAIHLPYADIFGVVRAAESGAADEALVPLENSTEGAVTLTTDLLVHHTGLKIRREVVLQIRHCLLAARGVAPEELQIVYSHPQAIAQCRRFLAQRLPQAEPVASLSTVSAVHDMKATGRTAAAISSRRAADVLGAFVAASNIEDNQDNRTRFVVLGREDAGRTGRDKTSICFDFPGDGPGILHAVLGELAVRRINMFKIESRPARSSLGRYIFLIDLEGHREEAVVSDALDRIRARTSSLKILGSYPQAGPRGLRVPSSGPQLVP